MRTSTLALVLVPATLSACGSGSLTPSGAAGTSGGTVGTGEGATGGTGTVGVAGASGTGGASGGNGGQPVCGGCGPYSNNAVHVAIAESSTLRQIEQSVSAPVTVTFIDDCPVEECSNLAGVPRIRLAADTGAEWTLFLLNTAMPSGFIKVGDKFDLTIDAAPDQNVYRSLSQTVVLARDGNAIVFAAYLLRYGSPLMPNLLPFGIALSDAGITCTSRSTGCELSWHALRVSVATDASIVLEGGQTGTIGGFSVTNAGIDETPDGINGCGSKTLTVVAGFRLPGSGGAGGARGPACAPVRMGAGGTTGTGGAAGRCEDPASPDVVELQIVGPDGGLAMTGASESVTVTSTRASNAGAGGAGGGCGSTSCQCSPAGSVECPALTGPGTTIHLTSSAQQTWTLNLRATAMPRDFVKVGDTFDMVVSAEVSNSLFRALNQSVTLSRAGKLALFAADLRYDFAPAVPNLEPFGVTIADAGAACTLEDSCPGRLHDARVTIGNESVLIGNGKSADVGSLRFTNGALTEYNHCGDPPKSRTQMAAFQVR